jgi:hypothetical protein
VAVSGQLSFLDIDPHHRGLPGAAPRATQALAHAGDGVARSELRNSLNVADIDAEL